MKLYLAAIYTNGIAMHSSVFRRFTPIEQAARARLEFILDSYHYIHKQTAVDMIRRDGVKVFLDSGAYSAHTQGVDIDLDKYCDYCQRNADIIEVASVLDGIGDPLQTYKNQLAMEERGCRPLPCYHYGEDERYLQLYIEKYEYITIGGMVRVNKEQLEYWLDRIWHKYLTDKDGFPIRKVHGFGLTRVGLMRRYPWYSVDSSTWLQNASNGSIMVPELGVMAVSHDSPNRKEAGRHYNTLTPPQQAAFREAVEKRGFDFDRVQQTYLARWTFNIATYWEINDANAPTKPFKAPFTGFF